jgi:hypothetical protein
MLCLLLSGDRVSKDNRHDKCFDIKIKQHFGRGATHWDTHAEEDLECLGKQTIITKEKYMYPYTSTHTV